MPQPLHPITDRQAFIGKMLCLSLTPLLVLVLGVSLGAAFPHDTLRKGCRLFKYQNIAHEQQKAADKMRQELVSSMATGGRGLARG